MSDVNPIVPEGETGDQPTPDKPYSSQIDSAFSAAWNDVFDPQPEEKAGEGGEAADAAATGGEAPAAAAEGTAAEPGAKAASADGAAATGAAAAKPDAGAAAADAGAAAADTGSVGADTGTAALPEYASVVSEFGAASKAIEDASLRSFRNMAARELNEQIGPKYAEALQKHPYMMVGLEVPNLRGEGQITLHDSAEAKEWQEAATKLIDDEINSRAQVRIDDAKPMMSVLQESVLLFQNNSDLVPGTKEFDKELADTFADVAKDYELRVNGKLYGYQVNVQPLINKLRTQIATQRGATGQQQSAKQAQAASQARTETGQFDAPQGGIPSKQGNEGGSVDDDYGTFFDTVGMKGMTI